CTAAFDSADGAIVTGKSYQANGPQNWTRIRRKCENCCITPSFACRGSKGPSTIRIAAIWPLAVSTLFALHKVRRMNTWIWIAIAAVVVVAVVVAAVGPLRRAQRRRQYERGRVEFHRRREHLEAKFFQLAAASGKPRGLRW